jgi:hypothetical protein
LKLFPDKIKKLDRGLEVLGGDLSHIGFQKILKSLQLRFQVRARKLGIKVRGYHQIELKRDAFLKGPDLCKSLHGVAGMAENDPIQEIELPLE